MERKAFPIPKSTRKPFPTVQATDTRRRYKYETPLPPRAHSAANPMLSIRRRTGLKAITVPLKADHVVPVSDDDPDLSLFLSYDDPADEPPPTPDTVKLAPPSKYRAAYNKVARNMRMLGYNNTEIAEVLGVHTETLVNWRADYPDFNTSWMLGGPIADGKVARALFKRAVGYEHPAEKIFNGKEGIVRAEYTERYAPDTSAGIFWLTNRQKTLWKAVSQTSLTGPNGEVLGLAPPSININVLAPPEPGQRATINGAATLISEQVQQGAQA